MRQPQRRQHAFTALGLGLTPGFALV